jgi:hypothetical protein
MIGFVDGPAASETLALRRAPILLRVVRSRQGKWDALDQPDDSPKAGEQIFVYRLAEKPTRYHLCIRGKGKKEGGFYWSGKYALLPESLADEVLRDTAAWARWCVRNFDRLMPEWAKKESIKHPQKGL